MSGHAALTPSVRQGTALSDRTYRRSTRPSVPRNHRAGPRSTGFDARPALPHDTIPNARRSQSGAQSPEVFVSALERAAEARAAEARAAEARAAEERTDPLVERQVQGAAETR